MKTSEMQYVYEGADAILFIRFRDEVVRCRVDVGDVRKIQDECSAIHIFEPKPGIRYARVYLRNGRQDGLHRFLLEMEQGDPRLGDHKNGNTLDCTRRNLRAASVGLNSLNRQHAIRTSGSGIRNVYRKVLRDSKVRWSVKVLDECLGTYDDVRDAAEAVWFRLLELDPTAATSFLRTLSPLERAA